MTRRQAYERAQKRRSLVIAATSTIIAITAVVVLVPLTPGWPKVKRSFFDGEVFVDTFPDLVKAFWLDVKIFLIAVPCIFVLALLIALARNTRNPALFPAAGVRGDLHRRVPRHPGDPHDLPDRLRRTRARVCRASGVAP